ncbi:amino acid ABC transporter permease [Dolosicoccus paucivorans]|uniref:Amino acid ABC transporter permease n=1 Tax=Dolosicoccus paucivorans TaxID=84521 RepID=A0A1G8JEM6_9LACT|nr:amino acid ABC transporter permease [Dolosicoccus paucivorans]PMB84490.1 amino acid ABC transporter permease [Dolosicoccus paucivorans]PMC58390.1 amino acid ABC transporter permease [Dolosicoccus paucivorans]SDI29100.1 amino acid ABC transporter membrane protein, PAAT family [Dolosicoccus paucivorans]
MSYLFDVSLAWKSLPFVLQGLGYTLGISLASFLISLMTGTILALMHSSSNKLLRGLAKCYISFFRGVPILVVLFVLYFGLPFMKVTLTALQASIIGFSLTCTAYSSEIIRASLLGVDRGQWQAARSLGLSYKSTLFKVIFPQSIRLAIPALSNVLLDLVKGSSLTAMITVPDIFQKAKIVGGANNNYMTMYLLLAIIYWVICTSYAALQHQLEKKFNWSNDLVVESMTM